MNGVFWKIFGLLSLSLLFHTKAFACEPVVNLGDTITFCQGNSITLNAANPNAFYTWSTGANTPTITVTQSGLYWVSVVNSCGSTWDSVEVVVHNPLNVDLGPNKTLCYGDNLVLQPPNVYGHTFLWQDGSKDSTYTVTSPGTYSVSVTNSCGTFSDQITVSFVNPPPISLGADTFLCQKSPVLLTVNPNGNPVLWSNGGTGNSISVNKDGNYWVEVGGPCGPIRDTINISYSKGPGIEFGDTINLCAGGSLVLDPKINVGQFLWSTNHVGPTLQISTTGQYWLKYTDACGVFYDTVQVVYSGAAVVDLGPDVSICEGDELVLDAGNTGSIFDWTRQDGSHVNTQTILVNKAGTYKVGVDNGCGFVYDSIKVDVIPKPDSVFPPIVPVCPSVPLTLDAGYWGPSTSYYWSTGQSGRTHVFNTDGLYWIRVQNACFVDTTFFEIRYDSIYNIDLGPDDTLCNNSKILFSGASNITDTILWSTAQVTPNIEVSQTGTYWVKVTNACGIFTDTIKVYYIDPLEGFYLNDVTICRGHSYQISLPFMFGANYLWSTGDTTKSITVTEAGYYYIELQNKCAHLRDSIKVNLDDSLHIDLGPDVVLCEPQIKVLNIASYNADSVVWSTGSKNNVLPVTQTGVYWVEAYNACGVSKDTISVTINELPKKNLQDGKFCTGGSLLLQTNQTTSCTYEWSTGDTTANITVTSGGSYMVNMYNDCGMVRDSIYVTEEYPLPDIDLGKDTVFCEGVLLLEPGLFETAEYTWQDGSKGVRFLVRESGTYFVKIENTCNVKYDTIHVLITGPPKLVLGTEVRFCTGNIFTLDAKNPGCTYLWNTGDSTQKLDVNASGIYWCTITNDCGQLTDTVEVIIEYFLNDLELGNDTIICVGDTFVLNTGYTDVHTLWQDGSTQDTFLVQETGMHTVRVQNTCGTWFDSIYVEVQDIPIFDIQDDFICYKDGELFAEGPSGMVSYQWSTGDTTQNILLTQPGSYSLTVSNACFSYTDNFEAIAEYPIPVDLGPDIYICESKGPVTLDPGVVNYEVRWSNHSIQPTLEVSKSGTYWARAENSCGVFYDTIKVQFDKEVPFEVVDTIVCNGDEAIIDLSDFPYDFEWFDGEKNRVRSFRYEGSYAIKIFNDCGNYDREFYIKDFDCDCPLYIPNAFTPQNNDGINDVYSIGHDCVFKYFRFEIFDRWGRLIYTANDVDALQWDGTTNHGNEPLPMGSYLYKLEYGWNVYELDKHNVKYGTINLLR